MPPRRRRRRKRLSLSSLVPEKAWPRLIQGLVAVALAALPASAVKMGADVQQKAANENVSGMVMAIASVIEQRDEALADRDSVTLEAAYWRAKYQRLARTIPTGPETPVDWTPQPVKRKKLFGIF